MMQNPPLTVEYLLRAKRDLLRLELLTDERGLSRVITAADVSSPGLMLTGFTERFPSERMRGASRYSATGPASNVADITHSLRSGRRVRWSVRSIARPRSPARCRS